MIAWFCSDGVVNFQKALLMLVSHVNLSVQYFPFSRVVEDDFFSLVFLQGTDRCVDKNPQTSGFVFSVPCNWLEINLSLSWPP